MSLVRLLAAHSDWYVQEQQFSCSHYSRWVPCRPADDLLDLAVAAVLVRLLGWHWKFLPAFAAELIPGVDLVPFWTLAVVNVYRKWKQMAGTEEESDHGHPVIEG